MAGSVTLKGWTLDLLLISWQEPCYPERMKIRPTNIMAGSVTLKGWTTYYRGHLVPKLRLGPFLTLSVRNGTRIKVDNKKAKNYNQHLIKHDGNTFQT